MNPEGTKSRVVGPWLQAVLFAALIVPILLVLIIPGRTTGLWLALWFSTLLLFNLIVIWLIVRERSAAPETPAGDGEIHPRIIGQEETPSLINDLMSVESAIEENGVKVFRGELREPAERVYEKLKHTVEPDAVPLVQQDPQLPAAIVLVPKQLEERAVDRPIRLWLHWLLFALTFLTTTWAGALQQGVNLIHQPEQFAIGLPYSIGLLAILGFHELGHYFTARHYGMKVTPPFFIPVPFALGTFGAFIAMRSPAENRASLFDVAVAGPLAGLVLAIPALLVGLQSSTVVHLAANAEQMDLGAGGIGSSILFSWIARLALGNSLGSDVMIQLSPLAFAGYLGLLVTALNLAPIGQLDGGHITRAMFGTRVGTLISRVSMWSLILVAVFFRRNLILWAIIVFFIARRGIPPQNDLTPISGPRILVGVLSFVILALMLIPMPR